jgi:hypothetical protein
MPTCAEAHDGAEPERKSKPFEQWLKQKNPQRARRELDTLRKAYTLVEVFTLGK